MPTFSVIITTLGLVGIGFLVPIVVLTYLEGLNKDDRWDD